LLHLTNLHERLARAVVRVRARLGKRQHRREAGVRALEYRAPLGTGLFSELFSKKLAQLGPARALVLSGNSLAPEAQAGNEILEELRLDGTDRDVLAVLRLVDVVPRRAGVQDIHAALLRPAFRREKTGEHRREQRRAFDHRGIDHLALSGTAGLQQRAGD